MVCCFFFPRHPGRKKSILEGIMKRITSYFAGVQKDQPSQSCIISSKVEQTCVWKHTEDRGWCRGMIRGRNESQGVNKRWAVKDLDYSFHTETTEYFKFIWISSVVRWKGIRSQNDISKPTSSGFCWGQADKEGDLPEDGGFALLLLAFQKSSAIPTIATSFCPL